MSTIRAAAMVVVALAACSGAPRSELGLAAELRVEGGQYYPGAIPLASHGPEVAEVSLGTGQATAGSRGKLLKGSLAPGARAVVIALVGDEGYWVVPAKAPAAKAPTLPTFDVSLSFSSRALGQAREIVTQASDEGGRFGAPKLTPLTLVRAGAPQGELVVSLSWDADADLDLHVVDPAGAEIFNRDINSHTPPQPGEPVDPNAWEKGGILDFDSNARCVIDGLRRENVIWRSAPPKGHYVVRVDTVSLCREVATRWRIEVSSGGTLLAASTGTGLAIDTRAAHDRGAGVLALEFDLP